MRNMHTVLFVLICCTHAACQNRTTAIPDFDPRGKMLFVEDYDGEGGLLSHNFGDLVIFDPVTKQKTRLTHDRYYDGHPSWSPDGQRIVFESIRMDSPGEKGRWRMIDLSDPTHLFILDIKTGQMTQFDKDFVKVYGDQVGEENMKPAWSPISNKIAFVTKVEGFREKLVVLDLDSSMVTSLTTPNQFNFSSMLIWSPKGDYLAFDIYYPRTGPKQGVVVMNVKSKETKLFSDASRSCTLLGWTQDGMKLILSYFEPMTNEASFYEYSLQTGRTSFLRKYTNVPCDGNQVYPRGSEIAFIGCDWSNYSYDIWLYNTLDSTCSKLTTDGHQKDGLMWYVKQ